MNMQMAKVTGREPRIDIRRSKQLSWLLRHGPGDAGVGMDPAGWAEIDQVLRVTGLDRDDLDLIVRSDAKGRLEVDGTRIRACQGHSTGNPYVDPAALEASWEPYIDESPFFHGTACEHVPAIASHGLQPMGRTHVHCAPSIDSVVGKRAAVAVMLTVDAVILRRLGGTAFVAPNGVILARAVPPHALVDLTPMTRHAYLQAQQLRGLLGLPRS
jgi:putative RNA 2'-phosphotransferase